MAVVEAAHGRPFWEAVAALHVRGLERAEAARALGYTHQRHLRTDPQKYGVSVAFQPPGIVELAGVRATVEQHARRHGIYPGTLYKRIQRWGAVDRVLTEPLAEVAMRVHNRRKKT